MGSVPAPSPIRLAILEADTPVPKANAQYDRYRGVFRHLFARACAALDPPAELEAELALSAYDVVHDYETYPDPEAIDAVLITGSKHNSFEDDEWILRLVEYTRRLLEGGRVRVIGVCFGHQIVGRALGSPVGRSDHGWEVSVTEMTLTEEGRRIFGKETLVCDPPFPAWPGARTPPVPVRPGASTRPASCPCLRMHREPD
jgi:GMP synthase-like glutamine amidotransferase